MKRGARSIRGALGTYVWVSAALVLVHNHPSGDPTPSPEDVRLTERLRRRQPTRTRPFSVYWMALTTRFWIDRSR